MAKRTAIVYPAGPSYSERFARRGEAVAIGDLDAYAMSHGSIHTGPTTALLWWAGQWGEVSDAPDGANPWVIVETENPQSGPGSWNRFQWPATFDSTPWGVAKLQAAAAKGTAEPEPAPPPAPSEPIRVIEGELVIELDPVQRTGAGAWLALAAVIGASWWIYRNQ